MRPIDSVESPRIHLSPGEILITRKPAVIVTVLGSCVAVTMFHRESSLSAMCHVMLAQPRPTECLRDDDSSRFRYASHAVPKMVVAYRRAGVALRAIEVKIFGGANVINGSSPARDLNGIGSANVTTVRALLEQANLQLSAENTGGRHGRKIMFNTETGEVLLKRLGTN
jgi:chemotaxis protein CheD